MLVDSLHYQPQRWVRIAHEYSQLERNYRDWRLTANNSPPFMARHELTIMSPSWTIMNYSPLTIMS